MKQAFNTVLLMSINPLLLSRDPPVIDRCRSSDMLVINADLERSLALGPLVKRLKCLKITDTGNRPTLQVKEVQKVVTFSSTGGECLHACFPGK